MRAIGLRKGDQVADIDILEAHGGVVNAVSGAAATVLTSAGKKNNACLFRQFRIHMLIH